MPIDIAKRLAECRTYTDARKILETLGASKSAHELMQLYYAQPDNSPYRTRFLSTVVQEMEDGIDTSKDKSGPHDKGKNIGDDKPTQEYELSGTGTGHSSSGESPDKEGTEKGTSVGDAHAQPTENQMKEGMPPMPGMMPPGAVPPEIAQQMEQMMTKMPPMNPMQQMRYTQECIKAAVGPLFKDLKGIKEAVIKFNEKIQEIQTKSIPLNIPGGDKLVTPGIRETMPMVMQPPTNNWEYGGQPSAPKRDLASIRQQIVEKDSLLRATANGKDVSQMYQ